MCGTKISFPYLDVDVGGEGAVLGFEGREECEGSRGLGEGNHCSCVDRSVKI